MSILTHSRAAWAVVSLTAFAALSPLTFAQAPAGATAPGLAPDQPAPMDLSKVTPEQSANFLKLYGYLIGQRVAGIKQLALTPEEVDQIAAGMKMVITANLTDDIPGGQAAGLQMQNYLQARAEDAAKKEVVKQKAVSDAFFANLDKDPDVKKTPTGLYYKIINPGSDAKPTNSDVLTVKYKGALLNGSVFDQTDDTGKDPANATRDFMLEDVIPGWGEGLKLIGKGGVIKLYIPAKLAYGDVPKGPIPAGSALQFDVTLVDFKPQPAPDMNSIQISP
ncbi:MAG TPA: FKBP-type peptidyl-prolyl cis-trans isomerase, partial [Opitutales bacterium]|nr:FKBP-type peptidyl-prolyl cis-trans isomerase [Opitutales bacterium]